MNAYEELIRDFAYERRDFERAPMTNKELAVIANAYSDEIIAEPLGDYYEMVVTTLKEGGGYAEVGAVVLGIMKGKARAFIKKDVQAARATLDEEERADSEYERGVA
jgi:hypothetical protein